MSELENENRDTSIGELLLAALLMLIMLTDTLGWAFNWIPTSKAVTVFLVSLTLFLGLESIVLFYRKVSKAKSEILAKATCPEKVFQFSVNLIMLVSGVLWLAQFHPRESGWTCFVAAILLAGQMLICQKFSK